ncbi:MAG: site-specific integrase [Bacteroides sp.]|nr:site-specific integrase [Bacteroides sp.]
MSITLGKRSLKKGRVSLYIDICYKGKRKKEYLGIIMQRPDTPEIRKQNKRKMLLAQQIKAKKELEFLSSLYEINKTESSFDPLLEIKTKQDVDFFQLMDEYLEGYHKKDRKMVKASLMHLHRFYKKKKLPVSLLNKKICINYLEYLHEQLHGNTPIGYFKKFSMCIDKYVDEGILSSNPAKGIKLIQSNEVTKQILTPKEIQKLALTSCLNNEVKRAFLFSCFCGLRWCDIYKLQYKDIDFQAKRITIIQQKVQSHSRNAILHLNLSSTAIKLLLKEEETYSNKVFNLPSYSYSTRILNHWVKSSGIHKHITFHCARHSFITNIMAQGANIKTAASLAGHSTTRHTEKYIHIIDELKQKAVDSLPEINIKF